MNTITILDDELWFPPLEEAGEEGLLAMGGDVTSDRLELAYRNGIFPWYSGDEPLWWSPDPRFVLFPHELVVSKSLRHLIRKNIFTITQNKSFEIVMRQCQHIPRAGQQGTWIKDELISSFAELHRRGLAISFEAWQQNQLVGGLYGIKMGKAFFGESMFSKVSNASKVAFVWAVEQMRHEGLQLIDCQVYTQHLESLGARFIPRQQFMSMINPASPA